MGEAINSKSFESKVSVSGVEERIRRRWDELGVFREGPGHRMVSSSSILHELTSGQMALDSHTHVPGASCVSKESGLLFC